MPGEWHAVDLDGTRIDYRIRLSARARRERITIHPRDGLTVVLPARTKVEIPPPVLLQLKDWVLDRLQEYGGQLPGPERTELEPGDVVLYAGREVTVSFEEVEPADSRVALCGDVLKIHPAPLSARHAFGFVREWMMQQMVERTTNILEDLLDATGAEVGRVTIRDQKTRWGSCSRSGNIALSWRLIMAPPEVLHSVIAHEVAHLRQPQHDAQFWALAEKLHPGIQQCRQWLHENGHRLKL